MSTADRMIRAFIEVFSEQDEHVVLRHRGGHPGYVHVVPASLDPKKRAHRLIAVELRNGTVCVTDELREQLAARPRPAKRIEEDDLGYSTGPNYGRFEWGLTHSEIIAKWGSERAFAEDAKRCIREFTTRDAASENDGDYA